MTEQVRQIIAENVALLKGRRVFIAEHLTPVSDVPPAPKINEPDGDVLDVLRAELEAAAGTISREELAAFAATF